MKRGMIELMVLSALFLGSPLVNPIDMNQSLRPVSGPTDPLSPKPIPPPPPPSPGPPEPKQPSQPNQPNQILPHT